MAMNTRDIIVTTSCLAGLFILWISYITGYHYPIISNTMSSTLILILLAVVWFWLLRRRVRTTAMKPSTQLLNLIIIIGMPLLYQLAKGKLTLDSGLEVVLSMGLLPGAYW